MWSMSLISVEKEIYDFPGTWHFKPLPPETVQDNITSVLQTLSVIMISFPTAREMQLACHVILPSVFRCCGAKTQQQQHCRISVTCVSVLILFLSSAAPQRGIHCSPVLHSCTLSSALINGVLFKRVKINKIFNEHRIVNDKLKSRCIIHK